ncbi:uncharacterized protein LOC144156219 [Haemaphysalis longicornis]
MPFGLRNAAQMFQRFIDTVTRGLPFVYGYVDDLLAASIWPLSNKVQAILDFPTPASVTKLREFLGLGRQFTIFTDHKPLTYAISRPDIHYTPREVRQLAYLSEYTTDIKHVSGVDNTATDVLSRVDAIASTSPLGIAPDLRRLAADQADDTELLRLRTSPTALKLEDVALDGQQIVCDLSTGKPRPFIPKTCRRELFDALHNMAHPGIRATQNLLAGRLVWPRMNAGVRDWVRASAPCQRAKVHRYPVPPAKTFLQPDERFAVVHTDLVDVDMEIVQPVR